ncbi:MAG: hypothetical protein ACFB4I_24425 [Cyanophyceae cyanobacterium]
MTNFKHINSVFNPQASKAAKAAREAEREVRGAMNNYKPLYYGLRSLWWKSLDKSEIWRDAYQHGELEQYVIAPGTRNAAGYYTPTEYDMDRINQDFWSKKRQEFYEQFESEFWLADFNHLSKESALKQVQGRTRHLLKVALEMFADVLVNEDSDAPPLIQVRLALAEINRANLEKLNARRAEHEQRVSLKHAETLMARSESTPQSRAAQVRKRKQQEAATWLAENAEQLADLPPAEEPNVTANGHS